MIRALFETLVPSIGLRREVRKLRESNAKLKAGYEKATSRSSNLVRENQRLRRSNAQLRRGVGV